MTTTESLITAGEAARAVERIRDDCRRLVAELAHASEHYWPAGVHLASVMAVHDRLDQVHAELAMAHLKPSTAPPFLCLEPWHGFMCDRRCTLRPATGEAG